MLKIIEFAFCYVCVFKISFSAITKNLHKSTPQHGNDGTACYPSLQSLCLLLKMHRASLNGSLHKSEASSLSINQELPTNIHQNPKFHSNNKTSREKLETKSKITDLTTLPRKNLTEMCLIKSYITRSRSNTRKKNFKSNSAKAKDHELQESKQNDQLDSCF
eukprot:TRINITY_DN6108_c0_g1_i2.p1 TRINITY_DN6108_c0_g1~~TRINITY_DN6108_c0_g1_i2.p1  ORF type:complete len:162 (-),score=8.56 TRINITY_DN6108_c0_g1_i2:171-656(-)